MTTERIRIALQKKGELTGDSFELLEKCGLSVPREGRRLMCSMEDQPIDVILVRDDEIPKLVNRGACDLGIVGENVFVETKSGETGSATVLEQLGFSTCRFVIAVPQTSAIRSVADLAGTTVATSYPNLLRDFLDANKVRAEPYYMSGSVEAAPLLGIADAIYDITVTGNSLRDNNLRELATGFRSQALLICAPQDSLTERKADIIRDLRTRMREVLGTETREAVSPIAITQMAPAGETPMMPLPAKAFIPPPTEVIPAWA